MNPVQIMLLLGAGLLLYEGFKQMNAGSTSTKGDTASLKVVNPNLMSQMYGWQLERQANGESPYDWAAFRKHLIAIGAPDPGPDQIPEFRNMGPYA